MTCKRTTVYMATDIHKALRILSALKGISMSEMINKALRSSKDIREEIKKGR